MAENHEAETRFFKELALQLHAAGFIPQAKNQRNQIPVAWGGMIICEVNSAGNVIYLPKDMEDCTIKAAKDRVVNIAEIVTEYMQIMEVAPQLKVRGLDGDYRILADFNGTVLAGHPTQYGVTFVTWDWDFNHEGLSHGHYFEAEYQKAKQDFATRSGLVPKDALLDQKHTEHLQEQQMGGMT